MKKMREKSKRMRKVLGLLMAAVLCIGMFPISAKAQTNTITYLALGDSITTGYGLTDPDTEGFAAKFADAIEEEDTTVTTVNAGVAGLTAETLATALATGSYDAQIAAADVITITIGGNDLMAAFYECVAGLYSSAFGTSCTSVNVQTWLGNASAYPTEVAAIVSLLSSDTGAAALSAAISEASSECVENIESIVGLIRAVNQDAVILLANQYNPYASLSSVAAYASISSLFDSAVKGFNTLLSASSTVSANCEIVDLYSAGVSTNVNVSTMNFDFHPNAAGHATIASVMYTAYVKATEGETSSFTWEIPIAVTVEQGGSAAAPAQDFQMEILKADGETTVDPEAIGVTIASDIVSTDGAGTCTATLTFTGTGIALQELSDGFCVRLVSGTAAGWSYDDAVYTVYAYFEDQTDASRMTSCEIYDFEDQTGETLLDAAAFTSTYTGWTLTFETNG
ncbi:MAG: GDSL-type esterase/lipase family protein, partial [Lachnospiraceae bacterium]|nr:GDSL-type esterase/lipase family protein [Lachnospiraceae bacterium]